MKFAEILEIRNGRNQHQVENEHGKYPIYGSGGIIGYANDYICESETVVIGRKGNINNPIFVEEPFWNVDTAFGLIADKSVLVPKYLFYFCQNYDFERLNTTVTIPSLTKENLSRVDMKVPSINKQWDIVGKLDKITKLIVYRKKELKKLDLFVQSRFIEMFGAFPEQEKLSHIADVTGGITKNSKRKNLSLKLPYLRVANVFFAKIDVSDMLDIGLTEEEKEKTLLQSGDLLFVEGNGSPDQIGRVAIWHGEINPCVHQNHLIKVRFDDDFMPVFAMYYFMTERGREQIKKMAVSTSGLYTLSVSKISDLRIPIPPKELQQQFAAFVHQTDKSKLTIQKSLEKLETLKKSLMQQYFG